MGSDVQGVADAERASQVHEFPVTPSPVVG